MFENLLFLQFLVLGLLVCVVGLVVIVGFLMRNLAKKRDQIRSLEQELLAQHCLRAAEVDYLLQTFIPTRAETIESQEKKLNSQANQILQLSIYLLELEGKNREWRQECAALGNTLRDLEDAHAEDQEKSLALYIGLLCRIQMEATANAQLRQENNFLKWQKKQ